MQRIGTDERIMFPRAIAIYYKGGSPVMYERKKVNTLAKEYEQILDIYEVDKYGNVYGKDGMELKQSLNSSGYKQVSLKLRNERRWKKCFVHRLVGYGFVHGYTEEKNEIDHIDGNKIHNKWYNLRWCTRKENMKNEITVERMWNQNSNGKCYVYDYRLNYIGAYTNVKEAQNELHRTFRGLNTRCKEYYILQDTDLSRILKINKKSSYHSIVVTDIETHKKYYFYSKTQAMKFFDNKVNITQAIQKNWTVRGKYKVRILNYKKLIGMLDL